MYSPVYITKKSLGDIAVHGLKFKLQEQVIRTLDYQLCTVFPLV